MVNEYTKIFSGNFLVSGRIKEALIEIGITPIVKDESESGRLAGFPSSMQGIQDIYVQNMEVDKAKIVVDQITSTIDSEQ
ncbi:MULTISPECIES: hypothetical protein [Arenibacter]|uniref:hypothetical protein n=1 Tax=Arenibacter TaxID=178469 RepID=UPI000A374F22|nr:MULTISPECIES: hypothetical protein [Arenibacter]